MTNKILLIVVAFSLIGLVSASTGNIIITKNTIGNNGNFFFGINTILPNGNGVITGNVVIPNTWGISFSPTQGYAYIGMSSLPDGNIVIVKTSTEKIIGSISNVITGSVYGVDIAPNGQYAYAVNDQSSNILVISTATNSIVRTISNTLYFGSAFDVKFNPSGTLAYVGTIGTKVVVINAITNTIANVIGGFNFPVSMAFNPSGSLAYVTNYGGGSGTTVSVVNTASNIITNTISGFLYPAGISIADNGAYGYVVQASNAGVQIFNTLTNTITGFIPLPYYNNNMMRIDPAGTAAWITLNNGDNSGYGGIDVLNFTQFNVITSGNTGLSQISNVIPGAYSVNEIKQSDWNPKGSSCTNGDLTSNIIVTSGNTVSCTFNNLYYSPLAFNSMIITNSLIIEGQNQELTTFVYNGLSPYTYNIMVYKLLGYTTRNYPITSTSNSAQSHDGEHPGANGQGAQAFVSGSPPLMVCAAALGSQAEGLYNDAVVPTMQNEQQSDGDASVTYVGNTTSSGYYPNSCGSGSNDGPPPNEPSVVSIVGINGFINNTWTAASSNAVIPKTTLNFNIATPSFVTISVACGYGNCDGSANAIATGKTGSIGVPSGCNLATNSLADYDGWETTAIYTCNSLLPGSYITNAVSSSHNTMAGTPIGAEMVIQATVFTNVTYTPIFQFETNQLTANALTFNSFVYSQNPAWGSGTFVVNITVNDSGPVPAFVQNDLFYSYQASTALTGVISANQVSIPSLTALENSLANSVPLWGLVLLVIAICILAYYVVNIIRGGDKPQGRVNEL